MSSPTPPKGSFEDLFRHHLAGEAAAVPPRAQVWEQLDNRLLLAENARYRRRLQTHRWALAASLLLASLAGGGWWQSQRTAPNGPASTSLASAKPTIAGPSATALAAARRAAGLPRLGSPVSPAASQPESAVSTSQPPAIAKTTTLAGASATVSFASTTAAAASGGLALASVTGRAGRRQQVGAERLGLAERLRPSNPTRLLAALAHGGHSTTPGPVLTQPDTANPNQSVGDARPASALPSTLTSTAASALALANASAPTQALAPTARWGAMPGTAPELSAADVAALDPTDSGVTTLAAAGQLVALTARAPRATDLALADAAALPTRLAAPALPELPPPVVARAWQFGASYASGLFSPNADFTKDAGRYNPSFGVMSASFTRGAAAEYRAHLRPGLSQRLSLWASRRLGNGRWSLRGGLELSQQTASSATSSAFVGEQVADFGSTYAAAPLRGTTFRYRAAGVSAEARYGHPAKTGFSLYGRVGALLSALFSARGEVEGNPEATRSYSLMSPTMPYRRLSGSVRGGGGLQFRPAGHAWALSLGPVAEMGIMSLNTDPSQSFWQQQRPYSVGLEAGLELGRAPKRTPGL